MMKPYSQVRDVARLRQLRAASGGSDEPVAALYGAVTGQSSPVDGWTQSVALTTPEDVAALVRDSDTAAVYAVGALSDALANALVRAGANESYYAQAVQAAATRPLSELRSIASAGWALVQKRAEAANDIVEGLGFDESDAWETQRELGARSPNDLARVRLIAKLAGRFFRAVKSTAKQRSAMPEEVVDVEAGADLRRVLPSEWVRATDPVLERRFIQGMRDRALAQYKMEGTELVGRGPLILLLDESGSMGESGGARIEGTEVSRNVWAKAVAVAMARVAHEQDRPVSVVHWSTVIRVSRLPKGDNTAMINMMLHFFSGGNDSSRAFAEAVREHDALVQEGKKGADVVYISDGQEPNSERLTLAIDQLVERGTQIWSLAVGTEFADDFEPRSRAHQYVRVDDRDLASDKAAKSIAGIAK